MKPNNNDFMLFHALIFLCFISQPSSTQNRHNQNCSIPIYSHQVYLFSNRWKLSRGGRGKILSFVIDHNPNHQQCNHISIRCLSIFLSQQLPGNPVSHFEQLRNAFHLTITTDLTPNQAVSSLPHVYKE